MAPRHLKKPLTISNGQANGGPAHGISPPAPKVDVGAIVDSVIADVKANGDAAVRRYSEKFDKWSPPSFKLSEKEVQDIIATVEPQIIKDIKTVQSHVRAFAEAQKASLTDFELEIRPGVFLGQKNVPIQNVGWYGFPILF